MPHSLDWLDDALTDLDNRGLRRQLSVNARQPHASQIEVAGQALVNFGSNDYLGLASDRRIAAAVQSAIDSHGWGAGASPLVTGRSDFHAKLERGLAEFEGAEASLLFPTGYAANVGTITALAGKGDAVYSDELNHASIIDGCRLSGAEIHVYPYSIGCESRASDLDKLANFLSDGRHFRRRLIITESIFSMRGTLAPLTELANLAREYDAMLMVDEAHATGVFGKHGRGICEQLGVETLVDVRIATLSKALGSHGGFAAGSQKLIDWLANRARPYVFSTAAPAATAAAGLAALKIVREEAQRRERLQERIKSFRALLERSKRLGKTLLATTTSQIVPIVVGDPVRAVAAAAELRSLGFFVPAIRPPSVPAGQSLLRVSLTCLHTDEQLQGLVAALETTLR
jgi:8-amino-7-oxononanoate synthase